MFISKSYLDTQNIAKKIAQNLKGNEIIALYGDLGAGKTCFTQGIAEYFGVKNEVSSPTFSILNEYKSKNVNIYHFDMYRINSLEDLESTGFFDYLNKGIFIIEWSENIEKELPSNYIKIEIEKLDEHSRKITINEVNLK